MNMEMEIMILDLKGVNEMEKINRDLKDRFENKFKSVIFYVERMVGVVYFLDRISVFFVFKLSLIVDGKIVKLVFVFLIWVLFYFVFGYSFKDKDVDVLVSCFVDNEELKYFFRFVEKYVLWVRNIYIVING